MIENLPEPIKTWIATKIGKNVDADTRFTLKMAAKSDNGMVDVDVYFDISWFILIYVEEEAAMKIDVVRALLKQPEYLQKFKATLDNPAVKRLIAEFLIFNFNYLDAFKTDIDFRKIDVPVDFISHALFIKRSATIDSDAITDDRLRTITAVLDAGFEIQANPPASTDGAVLHKILVLEDHPEKFKLANRLLKAHYKLFGNNAINNSEVAITLIDNRVDPDCQAIIKQYAAQFRTIKMKVADSDSSNIADYYYWFKEDMDAVHYIKETLGIEISPAT